MPAAVYIRVSSLSSLKKLARSIGLASNGYTGLHFRYLPVIAQHFTWTLLGHPLFPDFVVQKIELS
jgi:hypothetical protein